MATLIEKAKEIRKKPSDRFSKEELELVEAWLNDEIDNYQIIKIMNFKNGTGFYCFIARSVKELWNKRKP